MKVVGYGRVSTDDREQESSLSGQRKIVKQFCNEENEGEFGGKHELAGDGDEWWFEEEISGTVMAANRPEFSRMIDFLNENEDVDGVVVKNFNRLGRDAIDQITIQRDLEEHHVGRRIHVFQVEPWEGDRRSIMDPRTKKILQADNPRAELNRAIVFIMNGILAADKSITTSQDTKAGLEPKKREGHPIGRQPRGISTDKQREDFESNEATIRLPQLEDDDSIPPEDRDVADEFVLMIDVLNAFATSDRSPYQIGKQFGLNSPDYAVKKAWENKEKYRQAAENDPHNDWELEF